MVCNLYSRCYHLLFPWQETEARDIQYLCKMTRLPGVHRDLNACLPYSRVHTVFSVRLYSSHSRNNALPNLQSGPFLAGLQSIACSFEYLQRWQIFFLLNIYFIFENTKNLTQTG